MLDISVKELELLEMTYYVLEEREYHPFIFSHDKTFDNYDFLNHSQLFLEFIYFLGIIGINVEAEKKTYSDTVNKLLLSITTMEENHKYWFFEIKSIDYSQFDIFNSKIVEYPFLRLLIALKTGTALNKASICKIVGKELNSNDITQLKKIIKRKTTYILITNDDNSYSLGKEN